MTEVVFAALEPGDSVTCIHGAVGRVIRKPDDDKRVAVQTTDGVTIRFCADELADV